MPKTSNPIINFLSFLIPAIIITAGAHFYALEHLNLPLFSNKIILAYIINVALAILIYLILYFLREKQESNLGFIFMTGSLIKFGAFFLVFYPGYKADGDIQTIEFTTFFIPYAICLTIETFFLTKLLNSNWTEQNQLLEKTVNPNNNKPINGLQKTLLFYQKNSSKKGCMNY